MKGSMVFVVAFLLLASGITTVTPSSNATEPTPKAVTLAEWNPQLDWIIAEAERDQLGLMQQQHMNAAASKVYWLLDAKLYILFHRYLEHLPATERLRAREEQQRWLIIRKQQAVAAADELFDREGTGWPLEHAQTAIKITKNRIQKIEARFHTIQER